MRWPNPKAFGLTKNETSPLFSEPWFSDNQASRLKAMLVGHRLEESKKGKHRDYYIVVLFGIFFPVKPNGDHKTISKFTDMVGEQIKGTSSHSSLIICSWKERAISSLKVASTHRSPILRLFLLPGMCKKIK